MKEGIHPNYVESTVVCACGYTFKTKATKPLIKLDICSNCHPFFTGREKLIDSAGRVERFQKKYTEKVAKAAKAVKKNKKTKSSKKVTTKEKKH